MLRPDCSRRGLHGIACVRSVGDCDTRVLHVSDWIADDWDEDGSLVLLNENAGRNDHNAAVQMRPTVPISR